MTSQGLNQLPLRLLPYRGGLRNDDPRAAARSRSIPVRGWRVDDWRTRFHDCWNLIPPQVRAGIISPVCHRIDGSSPVI